MQIKNIYITTGEINWKGYFITYTIYPSTKIINSLEKNAKCTYLLREVIVFSSTCFQDNSTAQTASLEKLYSYELVVAGLVCINNTLILTCPNL